MPSIQIKNVPPDVHATLTRRAEESHQSLQEYLRQQLIEEANTPTLEEAFARVEQRRLPALSFTQAAAAVRDDRDRR
ncbi:MAG: FitA-like ribbon-helix-helix domain-containing protein [Cellulomonadaceae bacterium]